MRSRWHTTRQWQIPEESGRDPAGRDSSPHSHNPDCAHTTTEGCCWTEGNTVVLTRLLHTFDMRNLHNRRLSIGCNHSNSTSYGQSIGDKQLANPIQAFTGIHLGIITATTWMLMINGAVGYQAIDDGSFLSVFLLFASTAALFLSLIHI